ncbi:MAG: peptidase [Lachnospiraceae bacterium]|nr:peptidase [Lachnospiraceae bacterium]
MKLSKHNLLAFSLFFVLFLSLTTVISTSAAEESQTLDYYVRFSGQGLNIYADPSLSGEPIATLPDSTNVQILLGPLDSLVKIRVSGTELEGYTDIRYLKRLNAIVCDYDMYTYEEMEEDILQLQIRYPKLLHVSVTGQSADGRKLYELILGNQSAPKNILIHAGIHAREYANPYLVMEQLEQCLEYYDSGAFHGRNYRELFDNVAVHIVPMVNPDGIALSQFGESALRSPELVQMVQTCYAYDIAAKRTKSTYENYLARWKANARGVDLNRNFVPGFGANSKALQPSYMGYEGLAPFSEPETLSLGTVTLLCHPSIIINYHSMGEIAYWNTAESRYTAMNTEFSNYMLSLVPYKKMGGGTASGSYLDWIYSGDNQVCSITFETGASECPFGLDQYPKIWIQHFLVMQAAADYAYTH